MAEKMLGAGFLKVVVDRQRWLRGEGSDGESYLLRPRDDKMCCLGFACLAAGLTEDDICAVSDPKGLQHVPEKLKGLLTSSGHNSALCGDLMWVNDHRKFSDRESEIKRLGLKVGIDFEFVN